MAISKFLERLPCKGAYVKAWKRVKTSPDESLFTWDWITCRTAIQSRKEFSEALGRRINERDNQEWRNFNTDKENGMIRDSRRLYSILNHRIRVYQFETKLCQERFGHLLARLDD